MKDREKEIKYLIYLKSEIIREAKKEIKQLKRELESTKMPKTYQKRKWQGAICHFFYLMLYFLC